jgi:hypothetical protein
VDPVCDHMGPVELWRVRGEGEASGMIMVFFLIVAGPCLVCGTCVRMVVEWL